ncbi:hypothetical protein ADL22_15895 [Streptomyces sp. NRRL F-4489]|uniref:hypothetical protein n=1 Tax=Streptomyces sp. NRRL F-4489 TaxID=1609095 RepID=UPI000747FE3B|nr:hypothetical protein [Streptomyces sp. NRRL F-4489]KUL39350.1 hypothetical protein ADL22_15895 [Streptomyces sp. NRRL F-4489]
MPATPTRVTAASAPESAGLPLLRGPEITVLTAVDDLVLSWARSIGAEPVGLPAMVEAHDLAKIDYFTNFPHLAHAVATLAPAPGDGFEGGIRQEHLRPTSLVLPSAACYGAYFAHSGARLDRPVLLTTRALCSRAESYYESLRRLRTFRMREVIHIGTRGSADDFARRSKEWLTALVSRLDLDAQLQPASDPFFDADGSRAVMQRLSKVKEELVYGGDLAVSSVNLHRNFFGERCDIRGPEGDFAYSACFGAGLERWTHMLLTAYQGDAEVAVRELRRAGAEAAAAGTGS